MVQLTFLGIIILSVLRITNYKRSKMLKIEHSGLIKYKFAQSYKHFLQNIFAEVASSLLTRSLLIYIYRVQITSIYRDFLNSINIHKITVLVFSSHNCKTNSGN